MRPVKSWEQFQREAAECYFRALLRRSVSMSEAARHAQMDRSYLYQKLEALGLEPKPTGRKAQPFIEKELYR